MQTGCKSSRIIKHHGSKWKTLFTITRLWQQPHVREWVTKSHSGSPMITWLFTLPWRQGISQMERFLETLTRSKKPSFCTAPDMVFSWSRGASRIQSAAEVTTITTKNPVDCPYRSREHTKRSPEDRHGARRGRNWITDTKVKLVNRHQWKLVKWNQHQWW